MLTYESSDNLAKRVQGPAGLAIVSACPLARLVRSAGKSSWLEFQPVAKKREKKNVRNGVTLEEDNVALRTKEPTIASNLLPFTLLTIAAV